MLTTLDTRLFRPTLYYFFTTRFSAKSQHGRVLKNVDFLPRIKRHSKRERLSRPSRSTSVPTPIRSHRYVFSSILFAITVIRRVSRIARRRPYVISVGTRCWFCVFICLLKLGYVCARPNACVRIKHDVGQARASLPHPRVAHGRYR